MPATPVWLAAAEAWVNRSVQDSARAAALLQQLDHTALRIDVVGVTSFRVHVGAGRLMLSRVQAGGDPAIGAADACITGSAFALLSLAREHAGHRASTRASANPGHARATVSGDAEIASLYRQLIAAAQPDFEDELSRLVGGIPARHLAVWAGKAADWLRNTQRTMGENLAEYLQEESRDLVNAHELEEFLRGVDTVRETADRVAARLSALEERLRGSA